MRAKYSLATILITSSILILALATALWPVLDSYLVSGALKQLKEKAIETDLHRTEDLEELLIGIRSQQLRECTVENRQQLENIELFSSVAKDVGWFDKNGHGCSGMVPEMNVTVLGSQDLEMPGLSLVSLEETSSKRAFLAVALESGDLTYFAEPDLAIIAGRAHRLCEGECLRIELSSDALYQAYVLGDEDLTLSSTTTRTHFTLPASQIRMTNWISRGYIKQLTGNVLQYYVVLSAATGAVLLLLVWSFFHLTTSRKALIKKAIRQGQFIPFYQPIIDRSSGKVVSSEVLIRWKKKGQIIPPGEFIPYLESSDMIVEVTHQLIKKALKDISSVGSVAVSINLTPRLLESREFVSQALKSIEKSGVDPNRIGFEITERQPISDIDSARANIDRLRAQGITIKIDDAGTGYGGFSYFQQLPLDFIKIDRMFVTSIGCSDAKTLVVDEIIKFATNIGVRIVAEGVEEPQQADYLLERGVYLQQGFLFARPMPWDEFCSSLGDSSSEGQG